MMGAQHAIGTSPMPAVARILSQFDRDQLGNAIEVMIALLDLTAPVTEDEPDFTPRSDGLPGDPGDHEKGGDEEGGAYIEWHTTAANLRRNGQSCILAGHEDDEEDDPPGQCTEDEISTDFGMAFASGAGCAISDPDAEHDGREPNDGY